MQLHTQANVSNFSRWIYCTQPCVLCTNLDASRGRPTYARECLQESDRCMFFLLLFENVDLTRTYSDSDEYPATRTLPFARNVMADIHFFRLKKSFTLVVRCLQRSISFSSSFFTGISTLAGMWHAPSAKQAIGTATTGSSEAIQLGGLAMKKLWQQRRKAAGKSIHEPGYYFPYPFYSFLTSFSDQTSSWVQMRK